MKLFGLSLAIDNLAINFIDSLTFVGQYNVNKNLILTFSIVGGIMGAMGALITLNANSIYNNNKDITRFFKLFKYITAFTKMSIQQTTRETRL